MFPPSLAPAPLAVPPGPAYPATFPPLTPSPPPHPQTALPLQRETKGKVYYEFEFTAKTQRYTRHSLAVVTADKGRFYTLTTGANERRWGKMKDKLQTTVRSFSLINYPSLA